MPRYGLSQRIALTDDNATVANREVIAIFDFVDPVFIKNGVIHYCVTNMPGAFPKTATFALTDATLPYVLELAEKGIKAFENPELLKGLNICMGKVTNRAVAKVHSLSHTSPSDILMNDIIGPSMEYLKS